MKLVYDKGFFSFICQYHERETAKRGWIFWNAGAKLWQTKCRSTQKLLAYADETARELLEGKKAAETNHAIKTTKKIYAYQEQGKKSCFQNADKNCG